MTSKPRATLDSDPQFLERLIHAPHLAIDTEFVRERTYFPRLCLIQIATATELVCLDPLSLPDAAPLIALLRAAQCEKVIHSAGQDYEALLSTYATVPEPVFDTQIAASLLGYDEQISYAALVRQLLGVELAKSETRTDWCRRPLTPAQIAYAEDDVRYLLALRELLAEQLAQRGRLAWLAEDTAALQQSITAARNADDLLHRVGGQRGTTSAQRAVIRELAVWREHRARERDRPRKWILADETLVALARQSPRAPSDLAAYPELGTLPPDTLSALLNAIETARSSPTATWPISLEVNPFTDHEKRQIRAIQDRIQQLGKSLQLAPSRLASRRDIERLVKHPENSPLRRGWRLQVLGDELRRAMADLPD
ncbi:MAG: ribonuclease D [Thiotrichales bacterium]